MTATRRLAAILAADVAGYSRLIGADEEGALNRLKSARRRAVEAAVPPFLLDRQKTDRHSTVTETSWGRSNRRGQAYR
jgi:hypothetical protein